MTTRAGGGYLDKVLEVLVNLVVENVEDQLVKRLAIRAARHGRSVEDEHLEILRQALADTAPEAKSFKELLLSIPQVEDDDDEDFARPRDLGRHPAL